MSDRPPNDKQSLNDYAQSMFQFERIHPGWIAACADYLTFVFGSSIKDAVFLDYAFGRGNWSLAALQAGARKVVAIDAAEGNVRRFTDYCRHHDISNIEVIHGNILDGEISTSADVLWIYGILPCIPQPAQFVNALASMARGPNAAGLFYSYDKGSFRQAVVDAIRSGWIYRDNASFAADSLSFTPAARLRARDDLTAPIVNWMTAAELATLSGDHGFAVRRQIPDFAEWRAGALADEFSPHVQLCTFGGEARHPMVEHDRRNQIDFDLIGEFASAIFKHAPRDQARNIAVGLSNTHFSPISHRPVEDVVVEDFTYLLHAYLRLGFSSEILAGPVEHYVKAALAAMTDTDRGFSAPQLASSALARHLNTHTIRA